MLQALAAAAVTIAALLLSSFAAYRAVCSLPADLFSRQGPLFEGKSALAQRLVGLLLFAAGLVMALPGVPGQGVLTACVGLLLLDLPWLRRPMLDLLARPAVLKALNNIRGRAELPPLAPPAALP